MFALKAPFARELRLKVNSLLYAENGEKHGIVLSGLSVRPQQNPQMLAGLD